MRNDRAREFRTDAPQDVGTLWSMRRGDHRARCALLASRGEWQVQVLVDGTALLAQTCDEPAAAFVLAEDWQRRMIAQGWRRILPPSEYRPNLDERYPA
jgi:hypothetical protein